MSKIKKYEIILTTVFTVFASSLIVTQATNCTITTGSSLYNVELTHWQTINFADYCTGTISLNYNGKTGWNYLILGASVTSAGSTITLAVDDCKQIMIIYYRNSTSAGVDPPSVTIKSNSTTSVTHVNQSYLESKFQTVDGYLSDIDSAVSTIKLYLADILLDNDNIQTQLTTLGNYLSTTNTSLELIRQTIALTNTSLLSVISALNDIKNKTYQIPLESLSAFNLWRYNTVYYDDYWPYILLNTGDSTTETALNGLNSISFYFYASTNSLDVSNFVCNNSNISLNLENLNPVTSPSRLQVLTFTNNSSEAQAFTTTIHFDAASDYKIWPIYLGDGNNLSPEMSSLLNIYSTNSTTQKLSLIITYLEFLKTDVDQLTTISSKLDTIIEKIEADETTNNNVIEFNTNLEIINDIETDFNTDFGTHNNNLNIDQIDVPADFQTSVVSFKNVFTTFWNYDLFKYTNLLILLAGIILIILG